MRARVTRLLEEEAIQRSSKTGLGVFEISTTATDYESLPLGDTILLTLFSAFSSNFS